MKKIFFILILISFQLLIFSQNNINAPFVSKLTSEITDGKILLKWQNPENFNEYITIYRSNTIIDTKEKLLKAAKINVLKNKEEKYVDTPTETGNYFYAVIITKKSTNHDEEFLIRYRNYTISSSIISQDDFFQITKLSVLSVNSYNKINWEYEHSGTDNAKIMIYRNTEQINSADKIASSIKIATVDINTKLYIDVPVSNIPYYYAIFLEGEVVKVFTPEINFTTQSFIVNKKMELLNNFSFEDFTPLPLLVLKNDPESGKFFLDRQILTNPKKVSYKKNTQEIIENDKNKYKDLYDKYSNNYQKALQTINFKILNNEDIYEPNEYKVEYKSAIGFIRNKDFISSQKIFEEIIKNILPDELMERVSYYLGLIYYQNGDFYKSYMYLIYSNEKYKNEVNSYLKSIELNIFSKLER